MEVMESNRMELGNAAGFADRPSWSNSVNSANFASADAVNIDVAADSRVDVADHEENAVSENDDAKEVEAETDRANAACQSTEHEQKLPESSGSVASPSVAAPASTDSELKKDDAELKKDNMKELVDLLSKLNPSAREFVPRRLLASSYGNNFVNNNDNSFNNNRISNDNAAGSTNNRRKKLTTSQGKKRSYSRTTRAQREESIRRTVYVSDIDQQVTEEQLANLFSNCGQVNDCRICGDPNSILRFAFVEFSDENGARAALSLAGTVLGYYPVKVLPSKTAIAPVNPTFLPRTLEEQALCARTVYCTNIDRKVSQSELKAFFERLCGEVSRLRLLGDYHHSTRIAFVEFVMNESALLALNCSGAILGALPIRVSPSKTPVRPRSPRPPSK